MYPEILKLVIEGVIFFGASTKINLYIVTFFQKLPFKAETECWKHDTDC